MADQSNIIDKVFEYYKYAIIVNNGKVSFAEGVEKFETSKSHIWLVNPNQNLIELKVLESLDNVSSHVSDISGFWSCIIQDKTSGNLRAISSINNELPWYYYEKDTQIIASNIFLLSQQLNIASIDTYSVASFLTLDFCVSGHTFIDGIKKSYGGDIIYLSTKSLKIVSADLVKWLGFDNSVYDKRIISEQFIDSVSKSINNSDPQITLTAGKDSRAVLAGALLTKKDFKVMTGIALGLSPKDVKISKKISKLLGIEHVLVDMSKETGPPIEEILNVVALVTNAEFIPRNWILFYKEYILGQNNLKELTRIMGYGGEIFQGHYKDVGKSALRKLSILDKSVSEGTFDRVMTKYNDLYDLSKENARDLFYLRERFNFWAAVNIRAYSSYCHLYNPFSDPKLLSLGFRYRGGIRDIKLHEILIDTVPKEIKGIPINYSVLMRMLLRIKSRKVKKIINYEYSLTPEFLRRHINFELMNNIIAKNKILSLIETYESRGINAELLHSIYAVSHFYKLLRN
ncbi:MAG: hypothetical protein ACW99A_15070 [Candidatus Kariarchaeaceae archaeon]|jgi:hypothetical protein